MALTKDEMYGGMETVHMIVEIPRIVYEYIKQGHINATQTGQVDMSEEAFSGGLLCKGAEPIQQLMASGRQVLEPMVGDDELTKWLKEKIDYHNRTQLDIYLHPENYIHGISEGERHIEMAEVYGEMLSKYKMRGRL